MCWPSVACARALENSGTHRSKGICCEVMDYGGSPRTASSEFWEGCEECCSMGEFHQVGASRGQRHDGIGRVQPWSMRWSQTPVDCHWDHVDRRQTLRGRRPRHTGHPDMDKEGRQTLLPSHWMNQSVPSVDLDWSTSSGVESSVVLGHHASNLYPMIYATVIGENR